MNVKQFVFIFIIDSWGKLLRSAASHTLTKNRTIFRHLRNNSEIVLSEFKNMPGRIFMSDDWMRAPSKTEGLCMPAEALCIHYYQVCT